MYPLPTGRPVKRVHISNDVFFYKKFFIIHSQKEVKYRQPFANPFCSGNWK